MKKMRLLGLAIIIQCMIIAAGCGKQENTEKDVQEQELQSLEVGSTGTMKYEGVEFDYAITPYGAVIEGVNPEKGDNLIFPDKVGEYSVINVTCKPSYKEVKYPNISILQPNGVIEKISFYDDAKITDNIRFSTISKLKEITLPTSMKVIPESMFKNCQKLEKIDIQNVNQISAEAFSGAISLKEVVSNGSIYSVDKEAFNGCSNLQSIELNKVASIGMYAFAGCDSLKGDITFDELKVEYIDEEAFTSENVTLYLKAEQSVENPYDIIKLKSIGAKIVLEKADDWVNKALSGDFFEVLRSIDVAYMVDNTIDIIEYSSTDDGINVSDTDFTNAVKEYFNGKVIKSGESINISEIKHILDMINDGGKSTFTDGAHSMAATKYRIVDMLKLALKGIDANMQWVYDESIKAYYWDKEEQGASKELKFVDEYGTEMYVYDAINYNEDLVNTTQKNIEFIVFDQTYNDGEKDITIFRVYCIQY